MIIVHDEKYDFPRDIIFLRIPLKYHTSYIVHDHHDKKYDFPGDIIFLGLHNDWQ